MKVLDGNAILSYFTAFVCGFLCIFWMYRDVNSEMPGTELENIGSCDPSKSAATCLADFGMVFSESKDDIKNAVVERVVLRVRKNENSSQIIERNAIFVRYPEARGTIIMCHGFMCNKYDQAFLRVLFPGYNVLTFDFRAHGENKDGQVSTLGQEEAQEVIAAAHFVKHHSNVKDLPLYVYGFSMGAVAAIEAQAKDSSLFKKMILDCPFESSEKVLKRMLSHLKVSIFGYTFDFPGKGFLERYAFHPHVQSLVRILLKAIVNIDPRDVQIQVQPFHPGISAKKIDIPVLFIHCKKDKKVSVEAIKEVYNNTASAYKVLWLTNGRGHFDSYFYNPERYTDRVREFLLDSETYTAKKSEIVEDKEEM